MRTLQFACALPSPSSRSLTITSSSSRLRCERTLRPPAPAPRRIRILRVRWRFKTRRRHHHHHRHRRLPRLLCKNHPTRRRVRARRHQARPNNTLACVRSSRLVLNTRHATNVLEPFDEGISVRAHLLADIARVCVAPVPLEYRLLVDHVRVVQHVENVADLGQQSRKVDADPLGHTAQHTELLCSVVYKLYAT